MNILLVTTSYPPEIRSISIMMKELADDFKINTGYILRPFAGRKGFRGYIFLISKDGAAILGLRDPKFIHTSPAKIYEEIYMAVENIRNQLSSSLS